jgi:hypothetical protein
MRTTFFFLAMFASVAASAQTTVQIMPVSATYTETPSIQFKVSWTNQSTDNHRNKVWLFVDFQPVISPTQKGNWQPATITGTVQKTAGTVSEQSNRGFFIEGTTTNFSATVTVQLSNINDPFNWCAYASDYPPNAVINRATLTNGTYTLRGTPPFTIDGTYTTSMSTYSGPFIKSITDKTKCPGITYASTFTGCGVLIEQQSVATVYTNPTNVNNICSNRYGAGWRAPTTTELECICTNDSYLEEHLIEYYVDGYLYWNYWPVELMKRLWKNTKSNIGCEVHNCGDCYGYVRCVKNFS